MGTLGPCDPEGPAACGDVAQAWQMTGERLESFIGRLAIAGPFLDFVGEAYSWRMASGVGCIATYPAGGARADTVGTDVSSRAAQVCSKAMLLGAS
jgi:hypothetical protein